MHGRKFKTHGYSSQVFETSMMPKRSLGSPFKFCLVTAKYVFWNNQNQIASWLMWRLMAQKSSTRAC